jgi:hypothetical protein
MVSIASCIGSLTRKINARGPAEKKLVCTVINIGGRVAGRLGDLLDTYYVGLQMIIGRESPSWKSPLRHIVTRDLPPTSRMFLDRRRSTRSKSDIRTTTYL